jgi:hypothetical protein
MRSAGWTLFLEGDKLIASGGADALFLLDELDAPSARALHTAWHSDALSTVDPDILAKLHKLGALRRGTPTPLRFTVTGTGPFEPIANALRKGTDLTSYTSEPSSAAGAETSATSEIRPLSVIVRAGGSLIEAAERAAGLRGPQLFVDVAYHHTVSLGPLVWPGETACLSCLAGRIRHAWGDPEPPLEPRASLRVELIAALIAEQLRVFAETGTCTALVARTVSIDLETLSTRSERVHRLPWCPSCFPEQVPYGAGSFALPWEGT